LELDRFLATDLNTVSDQELTAVDQ